MPYQGFLHGFVKTTSGRKCVISIRQNYVRGTSWGKHSDILRRPHIVLYVTPRDALVAETVNVVRNELESLSYLGQKVGKRYRKTKSKLNRCQNLKLKLRNEIPKSFHVDFGKHTCTILVFNLNLTHKIVCKIFWNVCKREILIIYHCTYVTNLLLLYTRG